MPTFYADEDFPGPVVTVLPARGYDILTVQQDGRAGADDPTVLARAVELGRIVLTKNRNDFHRLHAAVPDHSGIITITDDPNRAALADRIHDAVSAHADLAGGFKSNRIAAWFIASLIGLESSCFFFSSLPWTRKTSFA